MKQRLALTGQLFLAAILLFGAWLVLVPAQTTLLWKLEILAREQGHWFGLLAIAAAGMAFASRRSQGRRGTALGVVYLLSAVALFSPIARAVLMERTIRREIAVFGDTSPRSGKVPRRREAPVELSSLYLGAGLTPRSPRVLPFLAANGDSLALDFHASSASGRSPLVVVIHGGSWRGGSRSDLPELSWYLADRGYAVASVSYRFAPRHQYPAARLDVRRAIDFLQINAQTLGIDPSRMVLLGRSAGGHLALLSAYADRDPSIRGVVGLYPVTDLRWGYDNPTNPRVLNSTAVLEGFLGGSPTATGTRYEEASPVTYASAGAPPTLVIHGDGDELVFPEHARRVGERLTAAGVPSAVVRLPWATHGCDYFLSGPCGQVAMFTVERFLAAVTR